MYGFDAKAELVEGFRNDVFRVIYNVLNDAIQSYSSSLEAHQQSLIDSRRKRLLIIKAKFDDSLAVAKKNFDD